MNTVIDLDRIYTATVIGGVTHLVASYTDVLKTGVYLHHALMFVKVDGKTSALGVGEKVIDEHSGFQTAWKFPFTDKQFKEKKFLILYF